MNNRLKKINNHIAYLEKIASRNTSVIRVLLIEWHAEKKYIDDNLPKNYKSILVKSRINENLETEKLHEESFRFGGFLLNHGSNSSLNS